MSFVVVSRAWRGETPYILSWARYYLNHLLFDKIIIIRCDSERFDFLKEEFGERIDFYDKPSNDEIGVFKALSYFPIPEDFDFVLSCDIDEYLAIKEPSIKDFVLSHEADSHFFRWMLCPILGRNVSDLTENLSAGCSTGHDGKSLARTSQAIYFCSEHKIKMQRNTVYYAPSADEACMLHFSVRGMEDLLIKSLMQGIKVENDRTKYEDSLINPPEQFDELPIRFKIAYFQSRLKKEPFGFKMPSLDVDLERLSALYLETGLSLEREFDVLFAKDYEIDHLLIKYPKLDFWQVNKSRTKSML
jgi:hypothetical protein